MKILAIETSTTLGSAAVLDGGTVLSECACGVRAAHAEQLLPIVRDALARAEARLDALDRIAVGIGPGSFTGVRIGLATAKGLSVASGVPLVGVSGLDALAASAWGLRDALLIAAMDARRGELYAAAWELEGDARRERVAPCNLSAARLGARLAELGCARAPWLVGDARDEDVALLSERVGRRIERAPGPCASPSARWVAWAAQRGVGVVDDGRMEPMYLRGSDAKLPAVRR